MSEFDREKWNSKYTPDEFVMGDSIKPFLKLIEPSVPVTGRALEIACGEGQTAVWLAQRGLEVTAIDISSRGLEKLDQLAGRQGVEERIKTIEHDLDEGLPELDAGFDLVTCIHFYTPKGIAQARGLIAPGGHLVVETLLKAGEDPSRFGSDPGEVLGFAGDFHVHYYREGFRAGRPTARLLAQKPPATTAEFAAMGQRDES